MKAIILSAGQGKRLLPFTANLPKCLVKVSGKTLLEWQIDEMEKCGINEITVVTGYGAEKVSTLLEKNDKRQAISTLYNPDYATTDNLVSCWSVREEMNEDFILLNGDTLFEAAVLNKLLASPASPITVTINHKDRYDADDMKVSLEHNQLIRIGKKLSDEETSGESIGMILFRGDGPATFRQELENAMIEPQAVTRWYLSVIDTLAQKSTILTCSIKGLRWCEVDCPEDLQEAAKVVADFHQEPIANIGLEAYDLQKAVSL